MMVFILFYGQMVLKIPKRAIYVRGLARNDVCDIFIVK